MSTTVTVAHNFETAHRLPHLAGKCESLHGHSWWVRVTVTAPGPDIDGVVVEFGAYKKALRGWIDRHLDHGTMLGPDDPLIGALRATGCKVYETPGWPTVETVAEHLGEVAGKLLADVDHVVDARVESVEVQETHLNRAGWRP